MQGQNEIVVDINQYEPENLIMVHLLISSLNLRDKKLCYKTGKLLL